MGLAKTSNKANHKDIIVRTSNVASSVGALLNFLHRFFGLMRNFPRSSQLNWRLP